MMLDRVLNALVRFIVNEKSPKVPKDGSKDSLFRQIGLLSTLGIYFVVATFLGLAIGYYLDKVFGTKPWLLIIFLLFGIAAGFINLFKTGLNSRK